MSSFDPEDYLRYRPEYPAATFAGLEAGLRARGLTPPYAVADVGCGAGHSLISLLAAGFPAGRVTGVDPDPAMLAAARARPEAAAWVLREGAGEATGLADGSQDVVLVGSAWHWMERDRARDELARVLRPGGALRIFEYQFPKSRAHPALDEWIRRGFNREWRAPGQRPRGAFTELTAGFRVDPRFAPAGEGAPPMVLVLSADELAGLLLSQSRVRHAERALPPEGRAAFREGIRAELRERLGPGRAEFDFRLAWIEFARVGVRTAAILRA